MKSIYEQTKGIPIEVLLLIMPLLTTAGRLPGLAREFIDKIVYALARKWRKVICPLLERGYNATKEVDWLTGA